MRQRRDAAAARAPAAPPAFPSDLSVSRSSGRTVPVPASEKLTIETPEQIALEFPLASAGSRFLAVAIDTLIQLGGFAVARPARLRRQPCSASRSTRSSARGRSPGSSSLAFVLYYGYYALFEALWNGQTPGKRADPPSRRSRTSGRPITVFDALLGTSCGSSTSCPASTPSACSRSSSPSATSGSAISRPTPSWCTNSRSNATRSPSAASRGRRGAATPVAAGDHRDRDVPGQTTQPARSPAGRHRKIAGGAHPRKPRHSRRAGH